MFGPVTFLGTREPGKTLIARTGGVVKWDQLIEGSERFQWLRDGQPIEGETLRTYTVKPADVGHSLAVAYTFETREGEGQVISEPEMIFDDFLRWLDASYWLLFGRAVGRSGIDTYHEAYKNGVPADQIMVYLVADKARGAK